MNPFNRGFVPPRSTGERSNNPNEAGGSAPTGFVDYSQNTGGFYCNLLDEGGAWDHSLANFGMGPFSTSQPVQEPEPEPEPENSRRGRGKKKQQEDGSSGVKKNIQLWSKEEEIALVQSWVDVSEDPTVANFQQKAEFWRRVRRQFFGRLGKTEAHRRDDSISGKWADINKKCTAFQSIHQRLKNGWRSGASDTDIISSALQEFAETKGTFNYYHLWEILRKSPKWNHVPATVGASSGRSASSRPTKKTRTTESTEPETPTSDARDVDLNEEFNPFFPGEEQAEELRRPAGRRSGKSSSSKGPSSSSATDEAFKQTFEEMNKSLKGLWDVSVERAGHGRELVDIMAERQQEKDIDFYLKPHDHLTGNALALVLKRKARIEKKYDLPPTFSDM